MCAASTRTVGLDRTTSSRPGDPRSTSSTSGRCAAETTVAPSLTMPDLTVAISSSVLPSHRSWSSATGVTTATSASTTLVESHSPPMPTSTIATSTGVSANAANATPVRTSKKLSCDCPVSASSASTTCT
ncbi:Uncharacterised protein [Mycobacteroides abscessus]|nr:Uncharacterised protein [Mycobacteroides abscessus]